MIATLSDIVFLLLNLELIAGSAQKVADHIGDLGCMRLQREMPLSKNRIGDFPTKASAPGGMPSTAIVR
jgi:hypothetical protein